MKEDDNVMNPAEDHHILATHQARVGRVNRTQWQYEPAIDVTIAEPPPSLTARARQRFGVALIRLGERLLPARPVPSLADGEPC